MKIKCTVLIMMAFLFPYLAYAGVSSLSVAVNGMACPFCAFGVEKRLKTVNGVAAVTVDMKTGTAMVTAHPDMSIRYQDVPQAVRDSGFTAGDIQITVNGHIEIGKDDNLIFRFDGLFLPLKTDSNAMKDQLRALLEAKGAVLLNGRISLNKNKEWVFSPESVEEVTPR